MGLKETLAGLRGGASAPAATNSAAPAGGPVNPFAKVAGTPAPAPAASSPAAAPAPPANTSPNPFAAPSGNAPPPAPPPIPGGAVNPPERNEPPEVETEDPSEPAEAGAAPAGKKRGGRPKGSTNNAATVVESSPELNAALVGLVLALTDLAKAATRRIS